MKLREMFAQVFMDSIYPLYSLAGLGSFSVAAPQKQVVLSMVAVLGASI